MEEPTPLEQLRKFEIPRLVTLEAGSGDLPRINLRTERSRAEVYLHGAHVTGFQRTGESPLLFLSRSSRFAPGKAIRGGVPICFPWFGSRAGDVAHGFARITEWELLETAPLGTGGVSVRLGLPQTAGSRQWPKFRAEFTVGLTDRLSLELAVTNETAEDDFEFEECLHSYFAVGDIGAVTISGLESTAYLDKLDQDALRREAALPIRITAQTDRTYVDTPAAVEIHDSILGRSIRIEKSGALSTVVWNPWTTQVLADLAPEEYRRMICVESGNVERNRVKLPPGETARLVVVISSLLR